jgi:hypothetical protein
MSKTCKLRSGKSVPLFATAVQAIFLEVANHPPARNGSRNGEYGRRLDHFALGKFITMRGG